MPNVSSRVFLRLRPTYYNTSVLYFFKMNLDACTDAELRQIILNTANDAERRTAALDTIMLRKRRVEDERNSIIALAEQAILDAQQIWYGAAGECCSRLRVRSMADGALQVLTNLTLCLRQAREAADNGQAPGQARAAQTAVAHPGRGAECAGDIGHGAPPPPGIAAAGGLGCHGMKRQLLLLYVTVGCMGAQLDILTHRFSPGCREKGFL